MKPIGDENEKEVDKKTISSSKLIDNGSCLCDLCFVCNQDYQFASYEQGTSN